MPDGEDLEADQPLQPALFGPEVLDQGILADAQRYVHTGQRLARKQPSVAEAICEDVVRGLPRRLIAKRYGVSRHTVRAVVSLLEANGKLAPIKERLSRGYAAIAEMANENIQDLLDQGKMPANVLPMVTGVATDKMLLLTGEATVRVETKEAVTPEAMREWLERIRLERMKRVQGGQVAAQEGATDV